MGTNIQVLIIVCTIICFASSTSDATIGTATFYKPPYVPSACYGYSDDGSVIIAGVSDSIWQNRSACGKQYEVTCIGAMNQAPSPRTNASVTVKIIDYCPLLLGCRGTINLSEDAFIIIAYPSAGIIKVDYAERKM